MPDRIPGDRNGKTNVLKPEKLLIIVRKHSSINLGKPQIKRAPCTNVYQ